MEGKLLDVNQALVTMLGYSSREEVLELNLARAIVCDPVKRVELLGHKDPDVQIDPVEIEWKRKDGARLKVRLSGCEIKDDQNKPNGYQIIAEDVTKQRELEDYLREQASRDSLTGLANYRHLLTMLDSEIKRSRRTGREFALLFFDLDHLKQINDCHGHVTGSQALCRLGDILSTSCRDIDTAARFGGDEFALVLPETNAGSANVVAQRICDRFANDGKNPKLSVSAGAAIYPHDGEDIETLLSAADVALYSMKTRLHSTVPAAVVMPYYVKSRGPLVFRHGPYKTETEARKQLEAMKPLPMYGHVLLYVGVDLSSPILNVAHSRFTDRDPIARRKANSEVKQSRPYKSTPLQAERGQVPRSLSALPESRLTEGDDGSRVLRRAFGKAT